MKRVLIYEIIGTFMLVYAILVSKGDNYGVTFTLFIAVVYTAPVSGAHLNPAVSTAVYVWLKDYRSNLKFYLLMMGA